MRAAVRISFPSTGSVEAGDLSLAFYHVFNIIFKGIPKIWSPFRNKIGAGGLSGGLNYLVRVGFFIVRSPNIWCG